MDKNIFRIPSAKYIALYKTFNPRVTFLVNLTNKEIGEILEDTIKFGDEVISENLEAKNPNFSIRAPVKTNTIFYLSSFNPNFEKIIGVEEIYSIFLICSRDTDQKKIKDYTKKYNDKTIGIILL